jgi:hypothetical protein
MGDSTHLLHISQNQNALDQAFPTQWFLTNLFAGIEDRSMSGAASALLALVSYANNIEGC